MARSQRNCERPTLACTWWPRARSASASASRTLSGVASRVKASRAPGFSAPSTDWARSNWPRALACANCRNARSAAAPSLCTLVIASAWIVDTTAIRWRARLKITFSRFSPPRWLIGPKFISILPSGPGA
ncbi:hypothetical protein D3C72_1972040 [compost metagenome]